jgi:U32 family peptidase
MLRNTELLLPAGSLEKMRAAYDFGADAVYAGQPRYSLRARNNDFRLEQIQQGIEEAHQRGKKFYLTSNLIAHNDKIRTYLRDIEPIIHMRPDGIIMADPGLIMMVREQMEFGNWPHVPIHLSVQANTTNFATVKFWQKLGVERIILSRELSLDEIERIRQECPDMELEVFVHGALCIAACCRAISTGATPTRAPAPTPAAGSTKPTPAPRPATPARSSPSSWKGISTSCKSRKPPKNPSRPAETESATRRPTRFT